jgi:hypothetical protein
MLEASKGRMADVDGTTATRSASRLGTSCKTAFVMASRKVEAGDFRHRLKDRSSCSTIEEDLAAATVMHGSALATIDALQSRKPISRTPRAAGYRGSDFVLWHKAADLQGEPTRRIPGANQTRSGISWQLRVDDRSLCAPRPFGRGRALPRGPEEARAPEPRLAAGLGPFG